MDKFFKITEKGSTVRTEIIAGITTFMAMAYILLVNPGIFGNLGGEAGSDGFASMYGAVYIATAVSAVIGTVLIGLLSNLPLAQASGMDLTHSLYIQYALA
ncbi:MAG: solute carrier family 23 protein [Clostridia bacterium]|nr:solute carrier family 23 protein [Clostridia bacterium]